MSRSIPTENATKTAGNQSSAGHAAIWVLIAAGVLLGALGMMHSFNAPREIAAAEPAPARTPSVKWKRETSAGSKAGKPVDEITESNIQIAGLRLRIDETLSSSSVSDDVNEADARLHSLITRHDRLAEMVEDLQASGIKVTLKIEDLIPSTVPIRSFGKPQVLDTANANARHPLYACVRDIREELANALREPSESADARIKIVEARLDTLAIRQFGVLDRIEKEVEGRHAKLASVPRALGIEIPGRSESDALGGPLVPLSGTRAAIYAFETRMEAVELTLANLSDIGRIVTRLPIRKPVGDGASISSGFGPRTDPFLGKPAMHQGLDFRASKGEEVMAAGAGTVLSAGRHGGYGNMVEIDHGQGLTSRYAHLSRIMVKAGDIVTPGQLIGKVGSTGRSTGPHLHFEVRRNGAARNPITYIRAGRKL